MRLLLFFFSISIISTLNAQDRRIINYSEYYRHVCDANILFASNKYDLALDEYDLAFRSNYPFPDDILDAIDCAIKGKRETKVKNLINLLVMSGYKIKNNTIYFKGRFYNEKDPFQYTSYQHILDSIYTEKRTLYLKGIDEEANKYLDAYNLLEVYITGIRVFASTDEEYNDSGKLPYMALRKSFINLLNSDIDISRSKTDSWSDDAFMSGLIHMVQRIEPDGNKLDSVFMDKLKLMVLEGNIHPMQYAILFDIYKAKSIKGLSYYGTRTKRDTDSNSINSNSLQPQRIFLPIYDIENVNLRRAKIGLPPLWVTAKLKNIKMPND